MIFRIVMAMFPKSYSMGKTVNGEVATTAWDTKTKG